MMSSIESLQARVCALSTRQPEMLGKLAFRRKFHTQEKTLSSSFHVDFFGAEAGILRAGNFTRIYYGFFRTSLFQTSQT